MAVRLWLSRSRSPTLILGPESRRSRAAPGPSEDPNECRLLAWPAGLWKQKESPTLRPRFSCSLKGSWFQDPTLGRFWNHLVTPTPPCPRSTQGVGGVSQLGGCLSQEGSGDAAPGDTTPEQWTEVRRPLSPLPPEPGPARGINGPDAERGWDLYPLPVGAGGDPECPACASPMHGRPACTGSSRSAPAAAEGHTFLLCMRRRRELRLAWLLSGSELADGTADPPGQPPPPSLPTPSRGPGLLLSLPLRGCPHVLAASSPVHTV